MINHKVGFDKSFQELLYRIDNWTIEGSGWIVNVIKSQFINISKKREKKKKKKKKKNQKSEMFL